MQVNLLLRMGFRGRDYGVFLQRMKLPVMVNPKSWSGSKQNEGDPGVGGGGPTMLFLYDFLTFRRTKDRVY